MLSKKSFSHPFSSNKFVQSRYAKLKKGYSHAWSRLASSLFLIALSLKFVYAAGAAVKAFASMRVVVNKHPALVARSYLEILE